MATLRPFLHVAIFAALIAVAIIPSVLQTDGAFAAGPPVAVEDKFNGGGTTDLDTHTPGIDLLGGGWSEVDGDWQVSKDLATEITGEDTPYFTVIDSTYYNFDLNVDITCPGNSKVGVVFRYQDEDNWFGLIYTGSKLELTRTIGGKRKVLDYGHYSWTPGETHTINLSVEDDQIEGAIDLTESKVDKSDLNLQFNSRVGLYFLRENDTKFKDFNVSNLGSPSTSGTISFPSASDLPPSNESS